MNKTSTLDPKESEILKKFILKFLPEKRDKRKSSGNEISYLVPTITRIFNKFYQIRLQEDQVLNTFRTLNYSFYIKTNIVDYDKKQIVPGEELSEDNLDKVLKNKHSYFVYINVNSASVKQLRMITSGISKNASNEKMQEKKEMIEAISEFRKEVITLAS